MPFDLATAKPIKQPSAAAPDPAAAGGFDLSTAMPASAAAAPAGPGVGVIPGTPPQTPTPEPPNTDDLLHKLISPVDAGISLAGGALTGVAALPFAGNDELARKIMSFANAPKTQTGQKMVEAVGDFMSKLGLQALPGIGGELGMLGKSAGPAARAGKDAAAAVKLPQFNIPGKGFVDRATGKTANAAADAAKERFGNVAGQAGERATEEANQATASAFQQTQDARIAQRLHEESTAQQAAASAKSGEDLLSKGVTAPKTPEQVGAALQDRLGTRMNEMFEARAKEASDLYTRTVESGRAKEAAGQSFATSPQGQAAMAELKALRDTARGTNPLLPQERETLNSLIAVIEGDAKKAKTAPLGVGKVSGKLVKVTPDESSKPAGVEALMKQLRLVRKYNESAAPAEGVSALPKQFAQQIERILEPKLYGEAGWLPEGGAADAAYKLASERLNVFGTEAVRRATRGEKFDFREMAASPSEMGGRFFKDGHTVRQLKAATNDPELVKTSATDWAASQLRPMKAAAAKEWVTKHADVLREAGIEPTVSKYVQDLQSHEVQSALLAKQGESRGKELAQAKQEAKAMPASIEAKRQATTKMLDTSRTELRNAQPKEVAGKVKQLGADLLKDGHITQDEYGQILREANELQSHYADKAKALKTLYKVGSMLGVGSALALGFPHISLGAENQQRSKRAYNDPEKERQYQEWKAKHEAPSE